MKGPSYEEDEGGPGLRISGSLDATGLRISGSLDATGLRIGVVAARFNRFVTAKLVDGACEALLSHGVREDDLAVVWTPGSFEVPLAAAEMARSGRWDALVCLGAVIKGETAHFDYVAAEAARGVAEASRETGVPMAFGVQTTYTEEQALARAGGSAGNRGHDAALAAIEMANVLRRLRE